MILDNASASPTVGILLQSTSTGQMRDVNIRVASGTTYLTAGNDMQFFNCQGVGVDADGGEQIGAIIATSVEGKIDVIDGLHDVPTADATTDTVMRDVIGRKTDTKSTAIVTTDSIMSYIKGMMSNGIRVLSSSAVGTTTTPKLLFTISGGSIHIVSIMGTVVTAMANTTCTQQIQATTTDPASTTNMSTAVDVDNDAKGTVYTFVGPTGVLTPTTLGVALIDQGSTTVTLTQWVVGEGTIGVDGGAVITGDIDWVITYYHNPAATVVAA